MQETASNLWEEQFDENGKSSLTENITPKVVKTYCKYGEHRYELSEDNNRELICSKCGMGRTFIPGVN